MKNNNMNTLVKKYKKLEQKVHVSFDDVMNKVTQEVSELIEAHLAWDISEMYKEAWDVIVNIYSVAHELWFDINLDPKNEDNKNPIELSILLWKWNSKVQWLRSRYSREDIRIWEVQDITATLVRMVLNYSDPLMDIEQIIEKNSEKFRSRVDQYISQLDVKEYIVDCPNFPKPGIDFKDISPILKSPEALRYICMELANKCRDSDVIVWLDSRGFLFGTMVAEYLGKPFVMVRKKWKLPWKVFSQDYWLEYGKDVVELQEWSIRKGEKVSFIDDLLATGWTIKAGIDLVEKSWWEVNNVSFVISLDDSGLSRLDSRKELDKYNWNSIVSYGWIS